VYVFCCTYRGTTCNNVPVTRTKTGRRCQAGWRPPHCTTGTCNLRVLTLSVLNKFWSTVCKTVRPVLSDHCLCVCLYCGQTAGWIKMPLDTEVGLGPGEIVLDGDPAPPPPRKRTSSLPPHFSAHVYYGQTVAHLSNC